MAALPDLLLLFGYCRSASLPVRFLLLPALPSLLCLLCHQDLPVLLHGVSPAASTDFSRHCLLNGKLYKWLALAPQLVDIWQHRQEALPASRRAGSTFKKPVSIIKSGLIQSRCHTALGRGSAAQTSLGCVNGEIEAENLTHIHSKMFSNSLSSMLSRFSLVHTFSCM